jgi:hypothetical protein
MKTRDNTSPTTSTSVSAAKYRGMSGADGLPNWVGVSHPF